MTITKAGWLTAWKVCWILLREAELDAFLELHPELQEDAALMEMTRLVPDQEVIFTDKASLKKEEGGRILACSPWGGFL